MADPEPDPEPMQTWIYGNFSLAKTKVALERQDANNDLVVAGLLTADAYIETNLLEQRLELPDSANIPSAIVQAATMYAIGDAIMPPFNSGEEENKKVNFYMEQADKFLQSYIITELNKKAENGTADGPNPYSCSQSSIPQPHHYPYRYRRG